MRKIITILAIVIVALTTVSLGDSFTVQAKSKKVTASIFYKDAAVIKQGTTVVKMKNSLLYYVKFKALKAGTYKLTFSGMRSVIGDEIGYGSLYVRKKEAVGIPPAIQLVKTNRGKMTHSLYMCTKYCWKNFNKAKYKGSIYDCAYTRNAIIKLKKGESIYLNGTFSGPQIAFKYNVTINMIK